MVLDNIISESERVFIVHGVEMNCRSDGRSNLEYRNIMIEQDVIETCSGSAHARSSNTEVMVGIKLELQDQSQNESAWDGKGKVKVFADVSAIASPAFEGKKGDDITSQIETIFSQFLSDHLELEKLVVIPNQSYFVLHVDIVILECSSLASLIDITSLSIKAALYDVRIPKVNVLSVEHNEFTLAEDEYDSVVLDASQVPIVTCYTKIGSKFVVDVTMDEEAASVGTIAVAFLPPKEIVLVKKILVGTVHLDSYVLLYEIAQKFGEQLASTFEDKVTKTDMKNNGKVTFTLN